MSDLVLKAAKFAAVAHSGSVRKFCGSPYVSHPAAVASLLESVGMPESVVAAGWLHDVVEDCNVSVCDLAKEFGNHVASLVRMVSNVSKPGEGNRAYKKAVDKAHLAKSSPLGASVKLADVIHNASSVADRGDPGYAKMYLLEKAELLSVLGHGHPMLLAKAKEVVAAGLEKLEAA